MQQSGSGPAIVLLHGLTATRHYVLMGSRALERSGYLVSAYDARGHGHSDPAGDRGAYGYERLASDLAQVLDQLELERVLLAGASMGAHTALALALAEPARVSALALITPGYDPDLDAEQAATVNRGWDALARGLREGGVEGFLSAYDLEGVPEAWRGTVEKVIRQRLSAHEHPDAVADALEVVPRSRPFESMGQLHELDMPVAVIASRDESDPGHPLALAERYAQTIPSARLLVEEQGSSPIAWQGGRLSRILAELSSSST